MRHLAFLVLLAFHPAVFAHGGEQHGPASKPESVAPSCPGGTGECCCAKPAATGVEPPAVSPAAWHSFRPPFRHPVVPAAAASQDARPYRLACPRAPPFST